MVTYPRVYLDPVPVTCWVRQFLCVMQSYQSFGKRFLVFPSSLRILFQTETRWGWADVGSIFKAYHAYKFRWFLQEISWTIADATVWTVCEHQHSHLICDCGQCQWIITTASVVIWSSCTGPLIAESQVPVVTRGATLLLSPCFSQARGVAYFFDAPHCVFCF